LMLRKRISYVVPWCLGADKDVLAWTKARITIDGSHYHLSDCPRMCTGQRGATSLAEAPCPSRRRFVALEKFLACGPLELSRLDDAPCGESGPVRLPADGAMAVTDER